MVMLNLELYEALKRTLNEDAARMIAEAIPATDEVVTRTYLDQRLDRLETRLIRYILAFFVPLWVAVLITLVTMVAQNS